MLADTAAALSSSSALRAGSSQIGKSMKKLVPSGTTDLFEKHGNRTYATVLADPPWRFQNRTGKMAPEHRRLSRYGTMSLTDIMELPVAQIVQPRAHLYLWVPNALILEGLEVMRRWGFTYKTNIVWYKR